MTLPPPWQDEPPITWSQGPLTKLRATILYSYYPYDTSFFKNLRRPSFLLLFLLSVFPFWGVQPCFWAALFLLLDKGDEYQLCLFILEFKAMLGVASVAVSLVGAAKDHLCITSSPEHHSCATEGPGMNAYFYWEVTAFFGQVALTWVAFLLLPYSVQKGSRTEDPGLRTKEEADSADLQLQGSADQERGGYLRKFLLYDVCAFILCAGFLVITTPGMTEWQFRSTLYWSKCMYGLCMMPFMIFKVPPLDSVLTHAKPTAYNPNGKCVPLLTAAQRKQKQLASAPPTDNKQ